jgi:aryl-alcohol dehydrogenase-like predicted oxidoreductase
MSNHLGKHFGFLGPDALPVGLGCSRIGSVNGATANEARELLHRALDEGIRFFDTSNIYGQGDSEKLIGEVLGSREDCIVCSKAGKYLPLSKQLFVPIKDVLRGVARRSVQTSKTISAVRAKPMPTCWARAFLTKSLDASLKRLRRPRIELFMLHSPPVTVLRNREAIDALAQAQSVGKISLIGASVDDLEAAEAALLDERIRALQIPFVPGDLSFDPLAKRAASKGVIVIAREVLGGVATIARAPDPTVYAQKRIRQMASRSEISITLIGTSRIPNLISSVNAIKIL